MFKKIIELPTFAIGFRPFFLLGSFAGIALMVYWLLILTGNVRFEPSHFDAISFHSHEMIFGFVTAIIAGFLLTASANWTGTPPIKGFPLLFLFVLWILGRFAISFAPYFPPFVILTVDVAFIPAVIAFLAPVLFRDKKLRNIILLLWLMLLVVANVMMHLEAIYHWNKLGFRLAVNTVVILIIVISGRVVPFFTNNAIPGANSRSYLWLDIAAVSIAVVHLLCDLFSLGNFFATYVAITAAVIHTIRWLFWKFWKTWKAPILWVLFLGYLWIPLGFALKALFLLDKTISESAMIHCWTAGAMGTVILGMISRVSLGHTGRKIKASWIVVVSYGLITCAVIARVAGVIWSFADYNQVILISGGLWIAAFGIYFCYYWPILTKPRADGKPG